MHFLNKYKYKLIGLVVALIVILTHGYNMFGYPYYENDEGIYMSQAWSVVTQGKLSPYTYFYDHAPAGWLLLAGWVKATGGFNTFGLAINSGRVLMLLLYLASAYFIFYIIKKYTNNFWAGALAVLVFALSPLAIYYQRRVLLDNIMIFWVLWSIVILLKAKLPKWQYWLSAVFFGLAVLTKESAVIFYPAILYLIFLHYPWRKYKLKILTWLGLSLAVISLYPFYAWTRGELFVNEVGSPGQHISLIETLRWQASRGKNIFFLQKNSEFLIAWKDWFFRDPFLTIGGLFISLIVVLSSIWKKPWRVIGLALLIYWIFLARGGLVFNFYIIPLIPFFVIGLGLLFDKFQKSLKIHGQKQKTIFLSIVTLVILFPIWHRSNDQYTKKETIPQKQIIQWVKKNLPADTKIAIDDYGFVDYHSATSINDKVFQNAHVFWKIENDNNIREKVFHNDWFQIQYIAESSTLKNLLDSGQLNLVRQAYQHSQKVKEWKSDNSPWAYQTALRKIKSNDNLQEAKEIKILTKKDSKINQQLQESWQSYKDKFIHNYGQVIDPANEVTTSEGQSYAMLRALWMDDEDTFRGTWQWAKDHFQFRTQDKLFSWKWQNNKLADFNNATDADEDIALALILANEKWGKEEYAQASQEILKSIWEQCVVEVKGHYYLLPINHNIATQWNGYLFNPSYLSPAWYRIFAKVDDKHNWNKLADDSYWILNQINKMENNKINLPPNWLIVEGDSGKLISAKDVQGGEGDYFGFDAFRILWRVALDVQWFKSQAGYKYLQKANIFTTNYYSQNKKLPMLVDLSGKIINNKPSIAVNAGYLGTFMFANNKVLLDNFYQQQIQSQYNQEGKFWQNPEDYYGNNWAWFATALYNGNLKK